MLDFASTAHPQAADFNYVPLLFVAYVIYAIISSISKAAKQASQSASEAAAPAQELTADQVRAALARRRAAMAGRTMSAPAAPTVVIRPVARSPILSGVVSTLGPVDATSGSIYTDTLGSGAVSTVDVATLIANLPPAAQAIVASAVIGPCAAHRGGGHNPEDW